MRVIALYVAGMFVGAAPESWAAALLAMTLGGCAGYCDSLYNRNKRDAEKWRESQR